MSNSHMGMSKSKSGLVRCLSGRGKERWLHASPVFSVCQGRGIRKVFCEWMMYTCTTEDQLGSDHKSCLIGSPGKVNKPQDREPKPRISYACKRESSESEKIVSRAQWESVQMSVKEQALYVVHVQRAFDTFPACDISRQVRTF